MFGGLLLDASDFAFGRAAAATVGVPNGDIEPGGDKAVVVSRFGIVGRVGIISRFDVVSRFVRLEKLVDKPAKEGCGHSYYVGGLVNKSLVEPLGHQIYSNNSHQIRAVLSSLGPHTVHSVVRLVQVRIPTGTLEDVTSRLDAAGVDYVVTEETSSREFSAVVTFPLPTNAVESVLAELREAGIDENAYTVVVAAETVISRRFDELTEEYKRTDQSENQIAREELQTNAENMVSGPGIYLTMTLISSVVATAGLLLDSAATVVGSMVIAPLIGPALAASVGTVVDDHELFVRGIKLQVSGIAVAIGSAALFAATLRFGNLVPPGLDPLAIGEIRERLAPNILVLAIALGSGVAGIISLMTGVSVALVGVMIAVALIPPAAAMGIGIAYGIPSLTIGAGVFVLVNVLSINLAALTVLWYAGYRPKAWFRVSDVRSAVVKRIVVLVLVILLLSSFLGAITYDAHISSLEEETVETAVSDVLDHAENEQLRLDEVTVSRTDDIAFSEVDEVVVSLSVPPDEPSPRLAEPIREAIVSELGYDVSVEVRYLEVQTAG